MKRFRAAPMTRDEADAFVAAYHRHNDPSIGDLFRVGCESADGSELVGIAQVGRPISRVLQAKEPLTAEVLRVCVPEGRAPIRDSRGAEHADAAVSFLYAACWRIWRAMGGTKLITYTLASESGSSLRAAGYKIVAELPARPPSRWRNRDGRKDQEATGQPKFRWERVA